jgi:hypothetical protein
MCDESGFRNKLYKFHANQALFFLLAHPSIGLEGLRCDFFSFWRLYSPTNKHPNKNCSATIAHLNLPGTSTASVKGNSESWMQGQ